MKLWGGKTSPTVTVTTPRAPFHICPPRSASAPAGSEVTRGEEHSKTGGASAARAASPPDRADCISLEREEITHVRSVTGPGRHPMGRVGGILMGLGSAEGPSLPTPSRP